MSENENTAPEDLPEFLNAEPDTTGEGLICTETGDRLSWEDLDRESVREFLEKVQRNLSSCGKTRTLTSLITCSTRTCWTLTRMACGITRMKKAAQYPLWLALNFREGG